MVSHLGEPAVPAVVKKGDERREKVQEDAQEADTTKGNTGIQPGSESRYRCCCVL